MQKSMPQSKQASVCITKHTKNFLYFQHQSTYLKQLSKIISKKNKRAEQVERVSLQNKRMMGSNFIEKPNTQQKNKDAPRVTHNAWSNKNIAHWKMTWCFCWWSGDALGIPKLWRLYLLDISWGDHGGIPKLELLSILHLIASFFSPYTWKLPSHKTHHNSH